MRIKGSLAKGLLVALILTVIPSVAISAQKITPGSPCKSNKHSATYLNVKYICSLASKKLVWIKSKQINIKNSRTGLDSKKEFIDPLTSKPCSTQGERNVNQLGALVCLPSQSGKLIWQQSFEKKMPDPIQETSKPTKIFVGGEACDIVGQRQIISTGYLECRYIADNQKKIFQISNNPIYSSNIKSPQKMETCQILDQRGLPPQQGSVGFNPFRPISDNFPLMGKIKIAIIPIDFSDFPGKGSPSGEIKAESKIIEKWFNHFSNGKLKTDISTYDTWIRAPKEARFYNWKHPGTVNPTKLSDSQLVQDLISVSNKYFDFTNLGALFLKYPKGTSDIEHGIMNKVIVNSLQGEIHPYVVSDGIVLERLGGANWAAWLHELLHAMGIAGHAPGNGWPFGIMAHQSGEAVNLSTWDQLIVNWTNESDVYCDDLSSLVPNVITLRAVDSEQNGLKSIVIKLSASEVLVIESRRKDFWSTSSSSLVPKEFPNGFYGVMAYVVNTKIDNDRTRESIDDTGNNPDIAKFAFFQEVSKSHNSDMAPGRAANYVMVEGESITTMGVKVSLVKSGDFDTVEVKKA